MRLEAFALRLNEAGTTAAEDARNLREEIQLILKQLGDAIGVRIAELTAIQGEKLDGVTAQITTLTEGNERRQETLRSSVEDKLAELKTEAELNAKALREEITVNFRALAVPRPRRLIRSRSPRENGWIGYRRA